MNGEWSLIRDCAFCAIDFESAGSAPGQTDHPVQIALANWSPGGGYQGFFDSYLRADRAVTWAARKVHGISDEMLVGAPSLLSLWPEVRGRLGGHCVVAHGASTEKRFLRIFPGHGFGPWVDTLTVARAWWPELTDHSLGAVCEQLGLIGTIEALVPGRKWHDAWFDAVASLVFLAHAIEVSGSADRPLTVLLQPDLSPWHRALRRRKETKGMLD